MGPPPLGSPSLATLLTEVARQHLVEEGPKRERYSLLHEANKLRGWLTLPEVIRTGKPVPPHPAQRDGETMALAMGEHDQEVLQEVVERCLAYAGRISTMLDVGGAVGHVARQFARCGVRATLLDRPEVMPFAKRFLGAEAANIALVGGDFTQGLPSGPFDLVYLGNVTHIYGPETNVRLLAAAFAVLPPGGVIAVQDMVWGRSPRAAMFAVNMLQATEEGGVWTEQQYRSWLAEVGFREVEVHDLLSTGAQLILGRRLMVSR